MRSLSPWSQRSQRDLVSQLEEFMNEFDRFPATRGMADFSPAVDMEDKNDMYLVTVDLPGMKKDQIKIDLNDNILTISGERKRETKEEGKYTERSYGRFMRSFTLPSMVSAEKIEARFEDGVLHINLPKAESSKGRSIKIM
ncbi:MAG: HspC2 heat shock protein [Bdellovibrio sp. ArHS]|uniref:Hsp20/alpha crystallin family protein n=1 Tax=Bdellovibrio sp. ArHS TaxID=1569284 RepID=UPI000582DD5D|nr:Hsp20/alpha crystallin family protein [Bdellovibrio sp. ArHS]KHD88441.1 MAG: HspC2 heat shock protein [Bdellovibrio sp. ArHS]